MSSEKGKRTIAKRLGLTICVFASGLAVSLTGLYKSGDIYASYDDRMHDRPPVDLVMAGAADGIYPWSSKDALPDEVLLSEVSDASLEGDGKGASVAADRYETGDAGQSEALHTTGDDLNNGSSKKPAGTDDPDPESGDTGAFEQKESVSENDPGSGKDFSGDRENVMADEAGTGSGIEDTDTESDTKDDSDKYVAGGSNVFEAAPDVIPDISTCPVCGAKDYGIADKRYLSPDGWFPEKDTDGMFAVNGLYRELKSVDENYFSDALYIGDSRVEGIRDYSGLEDQATFAFKNSMTIYKLFNEELKYSDPYGTRTQMTLDQVLTLKNYGKIYLQIGINEVGVGNTKTFYEEYRNVLGRIRARQPMALLYIDGIMHVTAAKSSCDPVFTNSNIVDKNMAISTLANGRDIFYIDVNPYVCDENGNLLPELTIDHAHLKAAAHERTREFLLDHAALP